MKTIEIIIKRIEDANYDECLETCKDLAADILKSIHEPDPSVVAAVADKLQMDATKVAAVWMLMVEEAGK